MFPVEHEIEIQLAYGDREKGLTVESFLNEALDFIEAHYEEIVWYYQENNMPFDTKRVAKETWDILRDGGYERP